ncbi:DUF5107 domain-containing protein [Salinibacterium soli]|uniref:DUF5107 domain-containing protein n=1 Tax=Antiquaquibacter soli TaxID=3064523 RepID=A0ABT9BHY9_9MICO|nr:DUF5107 domain-containing protein [Protaetiibacter sp. WY-16]MDO7880636.1 DUF5107 domain-containing protein [Protaetiibacter sp. WY-16]
MLTLPSAPPALATKLAAGQVIAWREPITIPTYEPGEPDRYPMYLDERVYQGSSGAVYPLPFIDSIATEPVEREWDALHLENEFVRLVILPELGGRIHVGFDKVAGYDFFYRNSVIKPALVGLAGPWVSGGVEFNWPQHHRPATFLPTDSHIEWGHDDSVTVWCSDHDPFDRMKGMHGIRLRPGSALIELAARLHNRTSERHTFLWWANVAAAVHDDYQSFFPTDVHWVADHARRAITAFPTADRPYYGVDYPARPGADRLDWYRNITVPTSYMVTSTQDDFFGGYDHRAGAGFVHWADRNIAPGKKQWTWGNAPFGHAWDAHLTDEDGPYVELMAGVYTDNQPDFSFIAPGETKSFTQYWYPYQGIGVVHQANRDAAVHLSVEGGVARLGAAVTRRHSGVRVALRRGSEIHGEWTVDVAPGHPFTAELPFDGEAHELRLVVGVLLEWQPRLDAPTPPPAVATEPPEPSQVASSDELHLIATHLEQYRHPTRSPLPYLEEALRRDPGDARALVSLAWRSYRAGRYAEALAGVDAALARQRLYNSNPRDGEPAYLRGLVLVRLGRRGDAYASFAKSRWNAEFRHAASLEMARLDAASCRTAEALENVREALRFDADDLRARTLLVVLLRREHRWFDAAVALAESRALDPLDALLRFLDGAHPSDDPTILLDTATELAGIGELDHALALFDAVAEAEPVPGAGDVRTMALYRRAHLARLAGLDAGPDLERARRAPVDRAFPHGLDDFDALVAALEGDESDARAHSLLGCLLYGAGRRSEALRHWLRALELGDENPVTLRNAALATVVTTGDAESGIDLYERALAVAPTDARLWFESDQLLARAGATPAARLARVPLAALSRDDLAIEYAGLLVDVDRATEAVALLESRPFQPWEGGEGRAIAAWERACVASGQESRASHPPASLGEVRGEPTTPTAVRADGSVDYFATSLPERLLFPGVGR